MRRYATGVLLLATLAACDDATEEAATESDGMVTTP